MMGHVALRGHDEVGIVLCMAGVGFRRGASWSRMCTVSIDTNE